MAEITRSSFTLPTPGPYIARITNHLDPTLGGGVEAVLEQGTVNDPSVQNHTFVLRYLSPFYGVTTAEFQGNDFRQYSHVQKSYGMWMVPPDIGSRVLCLFVNGKSNQGFWIGCIQETFQNHMIPGIAASQNIAWSSLEEVAKYNVSALPVAEFLTVKTVDKEGNTIYDPSVKPNENRKPVHPFAESLRRQGLLVDNVRGLTSSSARRETPSRVFGISTPGPVDGYTERSRTKKIGYKDDAGQGEYEVPASRLSGHSFVMDDGCKDRGNRLIRLRSGEGHQILLSDTDDVLYIANSNGTAWLEFTNNGKIEIYAQDSVSIHSEVDFNFRADRDINIEAGRNVHIRSAEDTIINADGEYNLRVVGQTRILALDKVDTYVLGDYNLSTEGAQNLYSLGALNVTASGNLTLLSASKILTTKMYAGKAENVADAAMDAAHAKHFIKKYAPRTKFGLNGSNWSSRYQVKNLETFLHSVPMHEPWIFHENQGNFEKRAPSMTDVWRKDGPNSTLENVVYPKPSEAAAGPPPNTMKEAATAKAAAVIIGGGGTTGGGTTGGGTTGGGTTGSGTTSNPTAGNGYPATGNDIKDVEKSLQLIEILKDAYKKEFKKALSVNSGPRTRTDQAGLYKRYLNGDPGILYALDPEKYPGKAYFHLYCVDVSIPESQDQWMVKQGWYRPLPAVDRVHYKYIGPLNTTAPSKKNPPIWTDDLEFIGKVKTLSSKFNIDYVDLLAVIEVNYGLDTQSPTRVQQVEKLDTYFTVSNLRKGSSINDVHMIIVCPRAYEKPNDVICFSNGNTWLSKFPKDQQEKEKELYTKYSGLDGIPKDGIITKSEACSLLVARSRVIQKTLQVKGII